MEFIAAKKDLVTAVSKAQGIPDQKNLNSVMAHMLFESEGPGAVRLTAQSYEVTFSTVFPAQVLSEGRLALSGRSVVDATRVLPDVPVRVVSLENEWARLLAGRTDYKIPGISPENMPERKVPKPTDKVTVSANFLLETVDVVAFAMSTDESRQNLNGVYFKVEPREGGLRMEAVATDGHRLARLVRHLEGEFEVAQPMGVIVHRRGIAELRRVFSGYDGNVVIGFQRNAVSFEFDSGYLLVSQIELDYPDYVKVLPTSFRWQVTLPKEAFLRAVQRASVMLTDRIPLVRLSVQPGRIQVSAQDATKGDALDEVDVEYDGEAFEIGFNARYLTDALGGLPGETAMMSVKDIAAPVAFTAPKDEGILQLVMPLRIS